MVGRWVASWLAGWLTDWLGSGGRGNSKANFCHSKCFLRRLCHSFVSHQLSQHLRRPARHHPASQSVSQPARQSTSATNHSARAAVRRAEWEVRERASVSSSLSPFSTFVRKEYRERPHGKLPLLRRTRKSTACACSAATAAAAAVLPAVAVLSSRAHAADIRASGRRSHRQEGRLPRKQNSVSSPLPFEHCSGSAHSEAPTWRATAM